MRLFGTALVLLFAVVISQGHPLSKSEGQDDKVLPAKLDEPQPPKETPSLKPKPEVSEFDSKPEIPISDLTPKPDAAPPSLAPDLQLERNNKVYDQRQNGTENYRIQVDGLVLVVAPAETLLLAGGAGSDLNGQANLTSLLNSSGIKTSIEEAIGSNYKPHSYPAAKPTEEPMSIKVFNLISPLLEQRRRYEK